MLPVDSGRTSWLPATERAARQDRSEAPRELIDAIEVLEWWRREHAYQLTKVNANLRYYLAAHGRPRVTQRLQKMPTIIYKLQRHPTMRLSTMQDIGGLRAVLANQEHVDAVVARLRRNWRRRVIAVYDYVREPKETGYRALHVVVVENNRRIEIQLRTPWQDMWAQSSEEDGARLGLGLKFGLGPDALREYYKLMAEVIAAGAEGKLVDEGVAFRLAKLHPEMRQYFIRHRNEP